MVVDKNPGLILIGTWGKGLYSYQPDSQLFLKKTLPIKPGINHKSFDCISALFLEHHNQIKKLWLGTVNNGLWIIDYTSGPPIPSKVLDIPDDWITDIKASPNLEQVFVTTRENGMYIYTTLSDQWEKISTATYPNLPGNHLNTCVVNPANKDDIFIGSEGEGIIQLNVKKGTFNTLKFSNEIPNNKVSVITPNEKNHHIWIGTEGNGAGRLDLLENKWTVLNTANNILNSDVVNCISIDHESAWIGTDNGLARFNYQNGKLRSYGIKDGLSSLMIYASTYDPYFPGPKPWITFYYGCPAIFDYDMDKW
jgi:ligand-binding sensor domain-containing protein